MVHGQVGEDFAVEFDVVFVQTTHENRVGYSVDAAAGVDTVNPQGAELALFVLSVAVGVGLTFFPFVFGYGPYVFASTPIAFGAVEDFFSACS